MATTGRDIKDVELARRELWRDGPPYEPFKQMGAECPIDRTERIALPVRLGARSHAAT
jgi:hypothetical protein